MRLGQPKALPVRVLAIEVAVSGQRPVASVEQEGITAEVGGIVPAQEVEQHRLVVAEQEDAGVALAQLDQPLDHPGRIRAPVDVVAEEDEAVARLERNRLEQLVELLELAVDVPEGVEHGLAAGMRAGLSNALHRPGGPLP